MARDLRVKVRLTADTKDAEKNLGKVDKTFGGISAGFAKVAAGAVAVGAAFRGLIQLLSAATEAAAEQEKAEVALTTALRNAGPAAVAYGDALKEQASQLQTLGVAGDEAIIATQALIAQMGVAPDQIGAATEAAVNLSAALGISLESAARNVGKTVGGFAGELGELIPELKTLGAESLKAGDGITLLNEKFSGVAAQQAETYAASVERLNFALGDTLEVIGTGTSGQGAASAVRNLAFAIEQGNAASKGSALITWLGQAKEFTANVAANFVATSVAILEYNGVLGPATEETARHVEAQEDLAEQLRKTNQEIEAQKKIQEEALAAQNAFVSAVEKLGVSLEDDVNESIRKNNELLIEADALYRQGFISRGDFERIERAVGKAERELNEELVVTNESLKDLEGGFAKSGLAAESYGSKIQGLSNQYDRATSAAARLNAETGGALSGVTARDSRSQADVDAALAYGRTPTLGGTRIRTADGSGSRLVRT